MQWGLRGQPIQRGDLAERTYLHAITQIGSGIHPKQGSYFAVRVAGGRISAQGTTPAPSFTQ
jgi:hypothetical protein